MGVELDVHDDVAVIEVSGVFSVDTAETIARLLSEHPAIQSDTPVLYDFLRLEGNAIEPGELRRLAREQVAGSRQVQGPMAIVVASDLDFGMARMYASLAEDGVARRRQIFRSRSDAWQWLVAGPSQDA